MLSPRPKETITRASRGFQGSQGWESVCWLFRVLSIVFPAPSTSSKGAVSTLCARCKVWRRAETVGTSSSHFGACRTPVSKLHISWEHILSKCAGVCALPSPQH